MTLVSVLFFCGWIFIRSSFLQTLFIGMPKKKMIGWMICSIFLLTLISSQCVIFFGLHVWSRNVWKIFWTKFVGLKGRYCNFSMSILSCYSSLIEIIFVVCDP